MRNYIWLLGVLLIGILTACGGDSNEPVNDVTNTTTPTVEDDGVPLQRIRVPMGYIADPQYAPFYVAASKGYFAEAGLEIEFDYSFETDGIALVGAGELPFAVVSGDQVILGRAQNLPLVFVFEWFQRFPIAVVSKASANITTPQDLRGRTVGLPGFFGASYIGYVGLLQANGMTEGEVNVSEIGFTQIEALMTDQVEAFVGYVNNEPLQLEARGEAINVLYVADYIDMVANGIVTNEETIRDNPGLVQGFVTALARGLNDTLANPTEAYEITKQFVEGLDDSRRSVLDASLPLWQSDNIGYTDPASWDQTHEILLSIGFLDAPLANLESAYTNQFVSTP